MSKFLILIDKYIFSYMQTPLILFSEKDHAYIHREKGKMLSVSGFIHNYEEPFDSDMIATRKVFKEINKALWDTVYQKNGKDPYKAIEDMKKSVDPKLYLPRVKEYVDGWTEKGHISSVRGTYHHKTFENQDYERGYSINPYNKKKYVTIQNLNIPEGYDNCSLADNLFDIEDGYYPEFLLFNEYLGTCGQSDKIYIETIGSKRYMDIDDYKFVNEILMVPTFFDHSKKKFPTMLEPISHLYQTNYYSYTLKISMYAWMAEQFGFTIRNLGLRQMVELINKEFIELPYAIKYRKIEINLLIDDFMKKN